MFERSPQSPYGSAWGVEKSGARVDKGVTNAILQILITQFCVNSTDTYMVNVDIELIPAMEINKMRFLIWHVFWDYRPSDGEIAAFLGYA